MEGQTSPCCEMTQMAEEIADLSLEEIRNSSGDFVDNNMPQLLKLPQEILVHIFSYIDADFLLEVVSRVCKELEAMLRNDQYWKLRLYKRFPKDFPIVHGSDFSMAKSCKECMLCWKIWKTSDALKNSITLNKSSGSTVDCVHLTEDRNLCFCGGRDRSITVWKLDPDPGANEGVEPSKLFNKYLMQHKGWVWSITSRDDEVCSTSFDTTVKFWDTSTLDMKQSITTQGPVLCSTYLDQSTVAVGCYNKKMLLLDTRSGIIVHNESFHKKAVLKIQAEDNYIVSVGEDGRLLIIDKRKLEVLQRIKTHSFAMALNSCGKQIWTGTKDGSVLVYNARNLDKVSLTAKLDYGFCGKITALTYTSGAVYAGCTDGWLKIYQPTVDPDSLAKLHLKSGGVTDISLSDKRLVVSTGDGLVQLWDPATNIETDISQEE